MKERWNVVVIGLSITSSWGNGHATTYRSLLREFSRLGHQVLFLEQDVQWYRDNRDLPQPNFCQLGLYSTFEELQQTWSREIQYADVVILGSFTPDGRRIADWLTSQVRGTLAFYDIDTPVTLAALEENRCDYLTREQIPNFDLYLSFTGGPTLQRLQADFAAQSAKALYCCADAEVYFPQSTPIRWDLGYMGTYSTDRQPKVDSLLLQCAALAQDRQFVIAGPQYPSRAEWPANVEYIEHLPPSAHRNFYNSQRFTLNVTRHDMITAGYSPSVRLFEAAACGTPIISDYWDGIETLFDPQTELLIARTAEDSFHFLNEIPEEERILIGQRARQRILREHTAAHRAHELHNHLAEAMNAASKLRAAAAR